MIVRRFVGHGAAGGKSGGSIGGWIRNLVHWRLNRGSRIFKQVRINGVAKVREALDFWSMGM